MLHRETEPDSKLPSFMQVLITYQWTNRKMSIWDLHCVHPTKKCLKVIISRIQGSKLWLLLLQIYTRRKIWKRKPKAIKKNLICTKTIKKVNEKWSVIFRIPDKKILKIINKNKYYINNAYLYYLKILM